MRKLFDGVGSGVATVVNRKGCGWVDGCGGTGG